MIFLCKNNNGGNRIILPDELNKGKRIVQMPKTTTLEET